MAAGSRGLVIPSRANRQEGSAGVAGVAELPNRRRVRTGPPPAASPGLPKHRGGVTPAAELPPLHVWLCALWK